jgi:hypothetical protein
MKPIKGEVICLAITLIFTISTVAYILSSTTPQPKSESNIIYYNCKYWTEYSITGVVTKIFWSGEQAYATLNSGYSVRITPITSLIRVGGNYTFDTCLGDRIYKVSEWR